MSDGDGARTSGDRRTPRALLCGLDGVLRVRDEAVTLGVERSFGVEPGTLDAVAFDPERLTVALTGQVSDTEWRLSVAAAFVGELGSIDRAADFVAAWSEPVGTVDESVRALVADVRRRGVRVVIVANATTRLETDLSVLGLRSAVDGVVSSARLGQLLPDPAVFREAARVADVPLEECLFFDTVEDHVTAARQLGAEAHRFTGVEDLRRVLGPVWQLPEVGDSNGHAARASQGRSEGGGGRRQV